MFGERLQLVLNHFKLSGNAFGDIVGVGGSLVSKTLRNKNYPSIKFLEAIHEKLDARINIDWLITGRGEMLLKEGEGLKTTPTAKGVVEPKTVYKSSKQEEEWRKKVDHKLKQHELMLEILAKPMADTVAKELMERAVSSYNEKK